MRCSIAHLVYDRGVRRAQSTVEYLLAIAVISIAVVAAMQILVGTMTNETSALGASMAESLTTDGVQ